MISQVIYVSRATRDFSDLELQEILDVSARNNAPLGISGLLLYANRTFMQVLEGETGAVDDCLARIKHDPRHDSVNILIKTEIPAREFKQWHMGFRRLNPQDVKALPNFAPFFEAGFNPDDISSLPDAGLALMQALAEHAEGEAANFA